MKRVAFLGMGVMGSRMARHLVKAGNEVTVWNRTPDKCAPVVEAGAAMADSIGQAMEGARAVLWCVSDDSAVEQIVWGEGGVLANAREGMLALDLSTVSPAMSRLEHEAFEGAGVHFLDAPVIGSRPQAEEGELRVVVGGDPQVLDVARPLIKPYAASIHRMGGASKGAFAKLAGNLVLAFQVQAASESLLFAKRSGVDVEEMVHVLRVAGYGSPFLGLLGKLSLERKWDVNFALKHLLKDANYIGDVARDLNLPIPGSAAIREQLKAATNQGWGEENIHAAVKALEWMAGTSLDS